MQSVQYNTKFIDKKVIRKMWRAVSNHQERLSSAKRISPKIC